MSGTNWITLLGGIYLLYNALQGLVTGNVSFIYQSAKRRDDAVLYWVAEAVSGILGVAMILTLVR